MRGTLLNKKKWIIRFIYFVIVAGTAGFAFYQYKQSKKEVLLAEKKDLIFPNLNLSQIKSFSLEKNGKKIHVFRSDEGWQMDSPLTDIADADLTKDWLESLLTEKIRTLKEKDVNWKEYDLHKPFKSIEVTNKSDEQLKLYISNYSAFDGQIYIKKDEKLLLGNVSWASLTNRDGDYFRSYKLLNKKKHPRAILYTSKLFKANLEFENYKWQWGGGEVKVFKSDKQSDQKKQLFPLSGSDLESYWSGLLKVELMKESYPNTQQLRKKYKLSTPAIELKLKFKENKSWFVKISPEINGKFYALISTRDYIFALDKEQREKVILTEKKIRDHREPFQFNQEQVYFMELKGYGLDVQLKKEKEKWLLLSGSSTKIRKKKDQKMENDLPADDLLIDALTKKSKEENADKKKASKSKLGEIKLNPEELKNIFNRIPVLSAKAYFREKNFKKTAHILLKNKENQTILKLEFSKPFEKASKNPEDKNKQFVYAVSSIGKEVMTLDFSALKFVFSPDLLKPAPYKEK